jgi:putative transcriptional regulator
MPYTIFLACDKYLASKKREEVQKVIEIRVDELLEKRGRSFYWLAKETGISHTTLWRLKKGRALGINFVTLEKICSALDCQPGDVVKLGTAKAKEARRRKSA